LRTIPLQELVDEFFKYHKLEHRTEHRIRTVIKVILKFMPEADTENFGHKSAYLLQNHLTGKYARAYINRLFSCIRRVFNWGVFFGIVSAANAHELAIIPSLIKGDGRCRENKKRKNCPDEHIETFQSHSHRPVITDMVELLKIHGMRPGELCNLRPSVIDFQYDGKNWLASPEEHKTASKGFTRLFVMCKKSQEILKKYMPDDSEQCFFLNSYGKPFTPASFGRAVRKVIDKHGLPKFVNYQLRHNAATKTAKEHGREYAQELLGHASPEMTDNYIHNPQTEKIQELANERNRKLEHPAGTEEKLPPEVIQFLIQLAFLQKYNGKRG